MSRERPLPADIVERFGHLPDHQAHSGGEHSSACPVCGGGRGGRDLSDRFRFWERQGQSCNFWCRRCGFAGFTDDNKPGHKPTEAEILELAQVRQREAEREAKRLQTKIDELRQAAYWQGYHDAMTEPHRALWRQAGIPDSFQDYWQLGFTNYRSPDFDSPALTIPYFSPGWKATTVQYRLTTPPAPNDKYRFAAGLRADLWHTDPDTLPSGAILLCEGMKKAAVKFIHTTAAGHSNLKVVSVPSKAPGAEMLEALQNADPLYICLDPDAYMPTKTKDGRIIPPAVNRLAKMLKAPYRLVKLPCKADDFFTIHGGTAVDFGRFIAGARV
jgi:hypothetical protein